ncbi:Hypothetical predicted protein [Mytilus galloprovincialis]|uniref:Uncharacterized protein n=1 Tax=Mytilus galloprovincialis TaxID=29158 RepID=A0A8B6CIE3_MYTGA|nr:Hypothetical predicted protein [Mytilus galloprovincialis]
MPSPAPVTAFLMAAAYPLTSLTITKQSLHPLVTSMTSVTIVQHIVAMTGSIAIQDFFKTCAMRVDTWHITRCNIVETLQITTMQP